MIFKHSISASVILILLCLACSREHVSPPKGEPTKFYLRDKDELSQEPGPSGSWIYATSYLYPSENLISKSWQVFLNKNISGSSYGYDLIVRSDSDAKIKIEFILDHEGTESILATEEFNIAGSSEEQAYQLKDQVEGTNPLSGKGDSFIFRIKYLSGTTRLEIYFDGGLGYIGNASITIPLI